MSRTMTAEAKAWGERSHRAPDGFVIWKVPVYEPPYALVPNWPLIKDARYWLTDKLSAPE